ncbi:MAG TPA: DUF4199 domain-containing protein [Thermoanaerobaculia bacterium]
MTRIVLTFGLIAGGILALFMAAPMPLYMNGTLNFDHSLVSGYTMMLLALILVVVGIRSYRDNVGGGSITFGKALQVGLLITLVASAVYVGAWEIIYWRFIPDFGEKYAAHMLAKAQASGATAAAIAKKRAELAHFAEIYKNPLINVGMTFMEIFPVGLIVTLVSAGFLRKVRTAV